jgi:hypothetical protein
MIETMISDLGDHEDGTPYLRWGDFETTGPGVRDHGSRGSTSRSAIPIVRRPKIETTIREHGGYEAQGL